MNVSNAVKDAGVRASAVVSSSKTRAYRAMDSLGHGVAENPLLSAGAVVVGGLAGWQLGELIGEAYDYLAN